MKRNFTSLSFRYLLPVLLLFPIAQADAVYTQVALTGFTQDVVANGVGLPSTSTTSAFDNTAYTLVAQNYQASGTGPVPTFFLPNSGTINSITTTGLSWQLASYTGNNSLRLVANNSTGTLTFGTTGLTGDIYVLGAAGDGGTAGVNATFKVNFSDGTFQQFTGVNFGDWYNGSPVAIQGIGRANRTNGVLDGTTTNPRLYEKKLTLSLSNYGKTITNILVTKNTAAGYLNIMGITVDHQTCLPVMGLNATGTTTTSSNLAWTAPVSTQGYEYAITTSATPPASGTFISTNSFNPTTLNAGTTYYLHVRNSCGSGSFSVWNSYSFSTLVCPTAGAPVTSNNIPGSVTITWPGSTDPAIALYQYAVTTSAAAPTTWLTSNSNTVTVNNLIPGTNYFAHVRSNCNTTNAAWQNVPFLNPFPPCFQPANINVSNINMTGATIRWNSGFNGISYRYAVSTSATPPLTGTTIIDTTFDAINLDPNTKYYVHLRTHCGTTNFSPWVIDSFMTYPTCQPPVTPVVTNVTASSAFVEWNYYPGIMNYEYFINQTATPPSINGYPTNSVAAAPIGLNSGTTYYVHVRTQCDTGIYSPWVTESFTTTILCVPPSVPVITNLGPTFASFSWGAVGAAQNYEHAITQAAQPPVAGTPTTNLNHTSNVLLPNTSYFFHVRAYCSASDISTWQSIPFTTQPLAIGDVDGNSFVVNVFPNPASDLLNIQVEGLIKGKGEVFLYDLSGKLVANMELLTEKNMLRIGQLAPGMYILKYVDSETTGVLRIEKR